MFPFDISAAFPVSKMQPPPFPVSPIVVETDDVHVVAKRMFEALGPAIVPAYNSIIPHALRHGGCVDRAVQLICFIEGRANY